MNTTLVIPQFGRGDLTCDCIRSLHASDSTEWPVVVVDDGGPDGSADVVRAAGFENVRVVEQPHKGVTAAWNRGAAEVYTPFVLFLNNDVLFDGPAVVGRLVEPLGQGVARMTGTAWRRERLLPAAVLRALPTNRFLEGWCFALRTSLLEELGGFDESMSVYWSDTDLQVRLLARFGADQDVRCVVNSRGVRHLGHRTACGLKERRGLWARDRAAFENKWRSRTSKKSEPKASELRSRSREPQASGAASARR